MHNTVLMVKSYAANGLNKGCIYIYRASSSRCINYPNGFLKD